VVEALFSLELKTGGATTFDGEATAAVLEASPGFLPQTLVTLIALLP
jgi:hypothetical protein